MADECVSVSIKYRGDGVLKLFTFPFTYMSYDDIVVFLYNETTKEWESQENKFIFANATTVEFFVPPPAPEDATLNNIWIARNSDLDQMLKEFYPGSAIRAQDLNDNFDQLRLAIQEGRCSIQDALNTVWKLTDVYTEDDQLNQRWVEADDTKLATSDAIRARHDSYVQENVPPTVIYEQNGKLWQNTDDCWTSYWQNSVTPDGDDSKTWVAYVNTGPRGEQGPQGPPGQSLVGPPGPEGPEGPAGEDGLSGGTFPDAPSDGQVYGRKDAAWEPVETSIPGVSPLTFSKPLVRKNDVISIDLLTLPTVT